MYRGGSNAPAHGEAFQGNAINYATMTPASGQMVAVLLPNVGLVLSLVIGLCSEEIF